MDSIFIKGARTHNLKNISIEINKLMSHLKEVYDEPKEGDSPKRVISNITLG